ncbi:UNVERIFIED_CONTAM: hypothetical protein Sindi_0526900 [Sesamum indicum]
MAKDPEVLKLQPSDNPGLSLVTTLLDGSNFLSWSRFGQSNGPMEYQLKRELSLLSQGSLTVSAYFSKLKRLWDELACITHTPKCTCRATKETTDIKNSDQLIQFVMQLNEVYDHMRNQTLMIEPLPSVYKKPEIPRTFQKKRSFVDKRSQVCKECGKSGHLKEVCFGIHRHPDWYKTLVEQRKRSTSGFNKAAAVMDVKDSVNNAVDEKAITEVLRTELHKILGGLKT